MAGLKSNKVINWKVINKPIKRLTFNSVLVFLFAGQINAQHFDDTKNTSTFKANFIEASKYCSSIYKTSLVEIIPMVTQNNAASNEQTMCFIFCMLQRYQMMDRVGILHNDKVDKFLDSMPDSNFKSSLKSNKERCLKEDAKNQCQKAYKFSTCFYRNAAAKV